MANTSPLVVGMGGGTFVAISNDNFDEINEENQLHMSDNTIHSPDLVFKFDFDIDEDGVWLLTNTNVPSSVNQYIALFTTTANCISNQTIRVNGATAIPLLSSNVEPILADTIQASLEFPYTVYIVVDKELSKAFFKMGGQKQPDPPENFTFLQTFTTSATWTVPITGWYKIHVIGKGGTGGKGGDRHNLGWYTGAGGGGGGGGGLAISVVYLQSGTEIIIDITSAHTSFNNTIVATSGSDGGNAYYTTAGVGGSGGTAVGGNTVNLSGQSGKNGAAGKKVLESSPSTTHESKYGGIGGGGSNPLSQSKYYSTPAVPSTAATNFISGRAGKSPVTGTSTNPLYGGSGSGGSGSGYGGIADNSSFGGTGAIGGIVIELGEDI